MKRKRAIKIRKGLVGKRAYRVSKVWRLGFHAFLNGEDFTIRLCYLRDWKGTHYIQLEIKVREELNCCNHS